MRLRFLTLAFSIPFALACGRGLSDSLDDTGQAPGQDAGEDGGGCANAAPFCGYGTCDTSDPIYANCLDGVWECPELGSPGCAEDAGYDACSSDPLQCPPSGCPEVEQYPSCTEGQWTCISTGVCPPDAGQPPASFACGDLACDSATSYCQIETGGAALPDGGVQSSYACNALPAGCGTGAFVQCSCLSASGLSEQCGCLAYDGEMIVTCAVP
jgi:hypothetical protein